jgi:hypothetical protein
MTGGIADYLPLFFIRDGDIDPTIVAFTPVTSL